MHTKIIEEMMKSGKREDYENMGKMIGKMFDTMKEHDPEIYEEMEETLYCIVYGYHFNEKTLEKVLPLFVNDDGTKGAKWSLDETNQIMRKNGIRSNDYNECDFCYTMNMYYSDHCVTLTKFKVNEIDMYVELVLDFLEDKDGIPGKAYKYYLMLKEG